MRGLNKRRERFKYKIIYFNSDDATPQLYLLEENDFNSGKYYIYLSEFKRDEVPDGDWYPWWSCYLVSGKAAGGLH